MKRLLLIGAAPEVLETRRVVLEGAGYVVEVMPAGSPLRSEAERLGASLIIIDASSPGADVERALDELCAGDSPSSIPVLTIGDSLALEQFDGPRETIRKPAHKRALLDSTRSLIQAGPTKTWSRRKRR